MHKLFICRNQCNRLLKFVFPVLLPTILLSACVYKSPKLIDQAQVDAIIDNELTIPTRWSQELTRNKNLWNAVGAKIVDSNNYYAGIQDINNDELLEYIDLALKKNYNLQSSAANLMAAFEQIDISVSELFPQLNGSVSSSKREVETAQGRDYVRSNQANLSLSWELDVWGRLSDASALSKYSALEQAMLYAAARNSLMVNVARAWSNYIFNEAIYKLSQQQLKSLEATLDIVESNYRVGLREASDVYLTRSNVESQRISVEQAREQVKLAAQNFYVLVGEYPKSTIDISRDVGEVPTLLPLEKSLPSELLLRRPDVLSAHYRYLSSLKNVDVRQKARYPSFTLNASIETQDPLLKRLVRFDDALWSLMAGVTQPIFNAGRLKSEVERAEFQAQAVRADYFQTMLTAFSEVEAALTSDQSLRRQASINELALEYANYSLIQNRELYSQGLEDIITVLSSEGQLFATEINRIALINQQVQNRLSLYLALGGDFYSNDLWLQEFAQVIFDNPDAATPGDTLIKQQVKTQ